LRPEANLADLAATCGVSPLIDIDRTEDFRALDPFFRIIEQGLREYADGEHFSTSSPTTSSSTS
jgi:hypothetical protein